MTTAQDALYAALAALDNQDAPLERYPDKLVEALARAGFAVVPFALPPEVLGAAAMSVVTQTGNPKHCWDYLLARVSAGPVGVKGTPSDGVLGAGCWPRVTEGCNSQLHSNRNAPK